MAFFVSLVIGVQIVVVQYFEYLEAVLQDGRENFALILSQSPFIGEDEINCFKRSNLNRVVHIDILTKESFGDFMSQSDAFFK